MDAVSDRGETVDLEDLHKAFVKNMYRKVGGNRISA